MFRNNSVAAECKPFAAAAVADTRPSVELEVEQHTVAVVRKSRWSIEDLNRPLKQIDQSNSNADLLH